MNKKNNFSFKKGFGKVQLKDLPSVKQELMTALGVNTLQSFRNYMKGITEPKVGQAEAIEAVFAKYGIKEVWGE